MIHLTAVVIFVTGVVHIRNPSLLLKTEKIGKLGITAYKVILMIYTTVASFLVLHSWYRYLD